MKQVLLILTAILTFTFTSQAQTAAPGDVQVLLEIANPDSTTNANLGLDLLTNPTGAITQPMDYKVRIPIEVLDSTGIVKVHVKLGNTQGGGEFFDHVIDLDDDANWPENFFIRWADMILTLDLGVIDQILDYYAEIRFEDDQGGISIPVEATNAN